MLRKRGASIALVLASAGLLLAAPGCGDGGPPLVNVTGTVTQNNQPLEGAAVMFMPDPNNPDAKLAEDTTGPDGNFKLRTGTRFGAIPGKYHVTIIPAPPAPSGPVNPDFADDPFMASMSAGVDPGAPKKGKKSNLPTEYTEDREITTESSQVHDFDVKLKAKEGD